MSRHHRHAYTTSLLASALLLAAASPASASILTGLVVVSSDNNGGDPGFGGGIWSTSTQNWWKLWVSEGSLGGAFVNGPNAAGANVNIPLTKGFHTFTLQSAGAYIGVDFFAFNMFFNGQTQTTQISAYTPLQQTGTQQPFFVNTSAKSSGMDLSFLPAAGTLKFIDGQTTVELTRFIWARPEVYGQDRISPLTTTPDRHTEFVGQFSLKVSIVPEPSSLAVWSAMLLLCVVALRRTALRVR